MRPQILHILWALCAVFAIAQAWTKEDHEIFRLRDELASTEGDNISFYEFVGVKPGATVKEIEAAFKKRSRLLHPDKARSQFIAQKSTRPPKKAGEQKAQGGRTSTGPSKRELEAFVRTATARYQKLGVIAGVLKGPQRERYDHFLRHGFPAWRGTGYYYSRYRPGLGTVIFGLFLAGGGAAHYGALVIGYNRQREFMDKYIRNARKQAWGDESGVRGIPGVEGPASTPTPPSEEADPTAGLNRRQKRDYERQSKKDKNKPAAKTTGQGRVLGSGEETEYGSSQAPVGSKRRVLAENGKVLIVDSIGNVFLEVEDEEGKPDLLLLDLDDIAKPTIWDTAVVRLPVWAYRKAFDPFLKSTRPSVSVSIPEDEKMQEDEDVLLAAKNVPSPSRAVVSQDLSASTTSLGDFELVDSAGLESDVRGNGGNAKKRSKKSKK